MFDVKTFHNDDGQYSLCCGCRCCSLFIVYCWQVTAQKTTIAALQQQLKEQEDLITALQATAKKDAVAQQQDRTTMLGLRKEILVLKEYENKYVVLKDEKDIMEEFYHEHNNENNQQLQTLNASLVECKQQRLHQQVVHDQLQSALEVAKHEFIHSENEVKEHLSLLHVSQTQLQEQQQRMQEHEDEHAAAVEVLTRTHTDAVRALVSVHREELAAAAVARQEEEEQRHEAMQMELKEVREALTEKGHVINAMQADINTKTQQMTTLQYSLDSCHEHLAHCQAQLTSKDQHMDRVNKEHQDEKIQTIKEHNTTKDLYRHEKERANTLEQQLAAGSVERVALQEQEQQRTLALEAKTQDHRRGVEKNKTLANALAEVEQKLRARTEKYNQEHRAVQQDVLRLTTTLQAAAEEKTVLVAMVAQQAQAKEEDNLKWASLQQDAQQWEKERKTSEAMCQALTQESVGHARENERLLAQLERNETQMVGANTALAQSRAQMQDHEQALQNALKEKMILESTIETTLCAMDDLSETFTEEQRAAKATMAVLSLEVQDKDNSIKLLEKELLHVQRTMETMTNKHVLKLTTMTEKCLHVKNQYNTEKLLNKEMKHDYDVQRDKVRAVETAHAVLRADLEEQRRVQQDNEKIQVNKQQVLQHTCDNLQQELDAVVGREKDHSVAAASLLHNKERDDEERRRLEAVVQDKGRQVQAQEEALQRMHTQYETLEEEHRQCSARQESMERQVEDSSYHTSRLVEQVSQLNQRREELEQELKEERLESLQLRKWHGNGSGGSGGGGGGGGHLEGGHNGQTMEDLLRQVEQGHSKGKASEQRIAFLVQENTALTKQTLGLTTSVSGLRSKMQEECSEKEAAVRARESLAVVNRDLHNKINAWEEEKSRGKADHMEQARTITGLKQTQLDAQQHYEKLQMTLTNEQHTYHHRLQELTEKNTALQSSIDLASSTTAQRVKALEKQRVLMENKFLKEKEHVKRSLEHQHEMELELVRLKTLSTTVQDHATVEEEQLRLKNKTLYEELCEKRESLAICQEQVTQTEIDLKRLAQDNATQTKEFELLSKDLQDKEEALRSFTATNHRLTLTIEQLKQVQREGQYTKQQHQEEWQRQDTKHRETMQGVEDEWKHKCVREKDKYDVLLRETEHCRKEANECKYQWKQCEQQQRNQEEAHRRFKKETKQELHDLNHHCMEITRQNTTMKEELDQYEEEKRTTTLHMAQLSSQYKQLKTQQKSFVDHPASPTSTAATAALATTAPYTAAHTAPQTGQPIARPGNSGGATSGNVSTSTQPSPPSLGAPLSSGVPSYDLLTPGASTAQHTVAQQVQQVHQLQQQVHQLQQHHVQQQLQVRQHPMQQPLQDAIDHHAVVRIHTECTALSAQLEECTHALSAMHRTSALLRDDIVRFCGG